MPLSKPKISALTTRLLIWYDQHGRDLPWRIKGGQKPDPYHVLVSEMMLQQTTVATVKNYYSKFLQQFPTVRALARAEVETVLQTWAGLGYYRRAKLLHACAQMLVTEHAALWPQTVEGLKKLPGLGAYTAGAMAAIAFHQPVAAVDGNVERVISRLHGLTQPPKDNIKKIAALTQALVPQKRAGDFAQALMDLGATVCTPRHPACGRCPWAAACVAHQKGLQEKIPAKVAKKKPRSCYARAYVLRDQHGKIYIEQRPHTGLLANMWALPMGPWEEEGYQHTPPIKAQWRRVEGQVSHIFTHLRLYVEVMEARISTPPQLNGQWLSAPALEKLGWPKLMQKIFHHWRQAA